MMQSTVALLAFSAFASAGVLPRQETGQDHFLVSDFAVSGAWPSAITSYQLDVQYSTHSAHCAATNSAEGNDPCDPSAEYPAVIAIPFQSQLCNTGFFTWELDPANQTSSGQQGFGLKLTYFDDNATPHYGCHFVPVNYTCTFEDRDPAALGYSTVLNVEPNFSVLAQSSSECIY